MVDRELAHFVLNSVFPDECDVVGPATVSDILNGVAVEAPEEGRPFPFMEILEILKDGAQIVAAASAIYYTAKRKPDSSRPTKKEVAEKVKGEVSPSHLSHEQIEAVLDEVDKRV